MEVTDSNYKVRTMVKEDIETLISFAKEEQWNPTSGDLYAIFETYSEGFLCGELNGEIVAVLVATKYQTLYCHIAFFAVKPEFRGKGYGQKLCQQAMSKEIGNIAYLNFIKKFLHFLKFALG